MERIIRIRGLTARLATLLALASAVVMLVPSGASAAIQTGNLIVADSGIFGGTGGLIEVDPGTGARDLVSANGAPFSDPSADFAGPENLTWEPDGAEHFAGVEGFTGDTTGDAILVADPEAGPNASGRIIRVDRETGFRMRVSDNSAPAGGIAFVDPIDVAVEPDGNIVVADLSALNGGALIRVNPTTGVRSLISDNLNPPGNPQFVNPFGLAIESTGQILVADSDSGPLIHGVLMRVDPAGGGRTTLADDTTLGAGDYNDPTGLPVDARGIYMSDINAFSGTNGGVFEVNATSGQTTVISQNGNPGGQPNFKNPVDLDVMGSGNLAVVDLDTFSGGVPGIMSVNPTSGDRDTISSNNSPVGGQSFISPWGIIVAPLELSVQKVATVRVFPGGASPGAQASGRRSGTTLVYRLSSA
ncbi:MAG: hypothetical protein M3141_04400, partial [Actinomycetota bacterium]|nr:hypothetical protein [Actinomycetota bacterium]